MEATQENSQINLCRALKLKNRLANRLSRLDQLLILHNSSVKDNREYDTKQLYGLRLVLAERLVALKLAISAANAKVQKQIYEVAECKALCKTLNSVDTTHGPKANGFGEPVQQYEAQFRKVDVQKEIRKVEREIDRLQDELDSYNFNTRIDVPVQWLNESDNELV